MARPHVKNAKKRKNHVLTAAEWKTSKSAQDQDALYSLYPRTIKKKLSPNN